MSYYLALNLILSLIHSYIQSTIIQCAGTVVTPRHPAENPVLALRVHSPEHRAGWAHQACQEGSGKAAWRRSSLGKKQGGKNTTLGPHAHRQGGSSLWTGAWGAGGLSLAAAQGRAPQEGPGSQAAPDTCPCPGHAKECGFTVKVIQKTEASHQGGSQTGLLFWMGCPGCGTENRQHDMGRPVRAGSQIMAQQTLVCLKEGVNGPV